MQYLRFIRLLALSWIFTGSPAGVSGQSDPACSPAGVFSIRPGQVFFNYGSGIDVRNSSRRTDLIVGQMLVGPVTTPENDMAFGSYGQILIPPFAPIVTATQGDLLDRIQISWVLNPLGPNPTGGFNLYRDGVFLATVANNIRNFNDFNVIAGRPYNYEVRGINLYGEGPAGKALGFQVPNGVVTGQVETVNGSPVPDALVTLTPMQGFSLKFDAGDGAFFSDTVSILPAANGEWTLTFWVKTNSAAANAGLMDLSPFPFFIRPIASAGGHEGIEVAQTYNSAAWLSGQFPDSTKNGWHNVALSIDADGKGRLYIDGALASIATIPSVPPSAGELRIGSRTGYSGWSGLIDELRLYHRRLDEIDLGEVMMGTASSLTPGLKYYWKLDEEQGTKSFDLIKRTKLYFCGAAFDADRPPVSTSGRTNEDGFYRIESVSYGTGATFLANPSKDFYMYRALRFVRNQGDYATLPDFSLTPKAAIELWINSTGPDGTQCVLSKKWGANDFRLLLTPSGNTSNISFYLNGQQQNFGALGMGYQHLAFTIDSSGTSRTVTAYKNGILLGSKTYSNISGNWSDSTQLWMLGARPSGMATVDNFGGLIDEIAVYDTTLGAATILSHYQNPRDMQEKGLRAYFALDEGSGNRLHNSGSLLLAYGTGFGADWTPFTARQKTEPHVFSPVTRQVTLNPSITSVDQVDFTDRSTVPVTGFVRYKNTDCFAPKVEILVNGASFNPKIFTDSTGKFVVDLNPGDNAVLSPVFEDHAFAPAFWEVSNVTSPIAGILFNDVTTRKVKGQVAGGLCKKSVIEAPAGTGSGTVCIVKVRSADGCLERQITIDNQEGIYEFGELPPLESLTVAVVEHSDPDVKAAFQVLGGSTVNLTASDTTVDFIYFAPPQVEIVSGLDPVSGCSPEAIVLEKGQTVTLNLKLKEQYVATPSDDGVCYLDTASFRMINGFSDEVLDTTMSGGQLTYKFVVGTPNPSPPHLKTLQILGASVAGREGSLTKQAVVTGIRNKANTFTTTLPEIPSLILRDPPGDGSSAYLEKNTSVCKTYRVALEYETGAGGGTEFHLGGNVNVVTIFPITGTGQIINAGPIFDIGAEFQVTYQKVSDSTFQTCMSVSEKFSTNDGDLLVGGAQGADIYVGEGINLIFGFADLVAFDENTCTPGVTQVLNIEPGTFPSVFMYSEYHLINNVMRYLDALANDPAVDSAVRAQSAESLTRWQAIIDRNAGLKEKAKFVRNISFDANVQYEYSETSDTTTTAQLQEMLNSTESAETHFGYEFNESGVVGKINFVAATSQTLSDSTAGTSRGITTGYVLSDDDPGDAYTVDVAMDSVYKTPVFRIKAGQSSCPWEEGTANREGVNLQLAPGNSFVATNVPANETATFQLLLGNSGSTNEDWPYVFSAIPAYNPHGAVIKLNGGVLDQPQKYIVPYGESVPITITIERGPIEYDYDSLVVALHSECEVERNYALGLGVDYNLNFYSPLYLGVHFIRPCSEVAINVPEEGWVQLATDNSLKRITVSGYDKNEPFFERVRVQYRRSDGDGAWINITPQSDILKADLGDNFTQFFWETAGLADGPYEIRAVAICSGDAADKPGYSQIIRGRIEREPPGLVGVPQPSDGVYQVGDEISFTFNKQINCDKLIPADLTQPNNVGLYEATGGQLIDINVTCYENKIVIDPTFQNEFYENRILRAELHDIEDKAGNKRSYLEWEFYVDRNELAWLTDSLGITKFEDEPKTGVARIHNRGGYPVPFKILDMPAWVQVVPNQGTLAPNETREINFHVMPDLAFGHWSDSIVLHTEIGQNPFFMGGDEPLPLGVRVVCRPPYNPAGLSQFENTMGMVIKVDIEGAFSTDPEDLVAAFIGDELRGVAHVQYVPQVNEWLAYLTVHGNPGDVNQPIRIEVWDASACQRYGSVVESFNFEPDNLIGIPTNPQLVHTAGQILREVPIGYGWNWLSFNLAFSNNSLDSALASLKHPQNDLIKSQGPFSQYIGGWFGSLSNLSNTTMYIYRADVPDTLRMQGTPIDPQTTSIPLVPGWNWIGYIPNYSLPVNEALISLPAQTGDIVKSQYAFAQFINPSSGWVGNLQYLSPPNGYQIKLAQAGTLTYPPPPAPFGGKPARARGGTEAPAVTYWNVDPAQFEHSSTLIGMIRANGANVTTSNMELGAFVGAGVRGTAPAIYIEPIDAHLFFLTTYANTAGELLHFKFYDDDTGTVYELPETMYFSPNQHQGSIETPVPFERQTTGAEEHTAQALSFEAQPNPFHRETALRFRLPVAQAVTLTISDAQGRAVMRRQVSAVAGVNTLRWNGRSDSGSWLGSGVYVARLQTETGSLSRKLVLQSVP
ncbi:MAG: T9SS type A sorting domain-containing protein [Thermoanaerobaculia bacterium]|nr:T9SS type A sorting domain-containing protein [Thermoanaerobaculia bacterium]